MPERYSGGVLAGYAPIQGALPWGGGGAAAMSPGGYPAAYNSALAQNRSNYDNIMAGYRQTLAAQTSASEAIGAGYTSLYNDVLSGIKGIGAGRDQAINQQAAQALGSGTQDLVNRGLGNTTVTSSLARGVAADQNRALTQNANEVSGLTANYQSQIGQARLQDQQRAQNAATGLSLDQLNFMNSTNAAYPNAGAYAALNQQYGQAAQAQRNARGGGGGGYTTGLGGGGVSGHLGYVPSAVSSYGGGTTGYGGGGAGGGSSWLMGQYGAGGGASGFAADYGGGGYSGASGFGGAIDSGIGGAIAGYGGFDWAGAGGAIAGGAGGEGIDWSGSGGGGFDF